MSDTPRTDTLYFWRGMLTMYDLEGEMKKFERELNAANTQIGLLIAGSKQQERQIEFLQAKIQRLVDAGDQMAKDFSHFWTDKNSVRDWPKAKEGLQ